MTLANGYLQRAELKTAIGDSTVVHDDEHDRAIGAASRDIDLWTGRYFYQEPVAVARIFKAEDRTTVCVGDFQSAVDVVVETDDDGDGIFETSWTDNQWQPEPYVRYNQWPFTKITTTTRSREFPLNSRRPLVRVTARWGWGAVPQNVAQACEALATLYFRQKDQAGVAIGFDDNIEKLSVDPIKVAMKSMQPYAVEGGTLYKNPECC